MTEDQLKIEQLKAIINSTAARLVEASKLLHKGSHRLVGLPHLTTKISDELAIHAESLREAGR